MNFLMFDRHLSKSVTTALDTVKVDLELTWGKLYAAKAGSTMKNSSNNATNK